jgi:DNA repair protein RadA/Sms
MAKTKGITVLLIGHITKDGSIAGPKVLEHMVDTVLAFDGDMGNPYRILRTLKNRFGAAFEMGVFRMISSGLEEVANPSEFFLEQRQESSFGSAVYCSMEGSRPILCEIQALTVDSHQVMPRRTSVGIELNRVHMVSAVLSRHLNMDLSRAELYINVVGGLRLEDPASDLALAAAVLSTERRVPLSSLAVFFGEIGLTGEVRAVQNAEMRIKEAQKLGFKEALVPIANKKYMPPTDMKIHWVKNVTDLESWITKTGRSTPPR